ncbi:hypothetical protein GCM10009679_65450 [Saccharothrix algeriensis]|uniref:Uncharacterized protein n=2 Tax=Catellatospora bangladeshensis TaxID=310355 RepID=A0A8J3JY90_9ACTN|nr:hypothetical protein Cba03nite_72280 [Catellatospora bangladeshensis]
MTDDVRMAHDLSRIDPHRFEQMVLALGVRVLGYGLRSFGAGADGGREATFDGPVPYPAPGPGSWNGYIVVQAKCRRTKIGVKDAEWLIGQIKSELRAWLNPASSRARTRRPQYLIIATNVQLSSTASSGGIDRVEAAMKEQAAELGLLDWAVWDGNQLSTFLDAHPEVARTYADVISSGDVLTKALETIDALGRSVSPTPIRLGQGQPGAERKFQAAYDKAGGAAVLGMPTTEAYEEGPGWVQEFPHAVICAAAEGPAVAVDLPVWEALLDAGAGHGRLAAVGYPIVDAHTPAFIDDRAQPVRLHGGTWNDGHLLQKMGGWRWEPKITFSFNIRDHDRWRHVEPLMDLRLRCALRVNWQASHELTIDAQGRRNMKSFVAGSWLSGFIVRQANRWGLDGSSLKWQLTPDDEGYNDSRFACYRVMLGSPPGPAIGAWLRLSLPDSLRGEVSCIIDLRVNFPHLQPPDSLADGLALAAASRPLDVQDLVEFFAGAWEANAWFLPRAASPNLLFCKTVGAPVIECHIVAERSPGRGLPYTVDLLQVVDLSMYGEAPANPRPMMGASVSAPTSLELPQITTTVIQLLAHMASGFGFLESED